MLIGLVLLAVLLKDTMLTTPKLTWVPLRREPLAMALASAVSGPNKREGVGVQIERSVATRRAESAL